MEEKNEFEEIDLSALFTLIKKKILLILTLVVVGAILSLSFTIFFIDKEYASNASIYLKPKIVEGNVDNNNITATQKLINDYIIIMKSDTVLTPAANDLGLSTNELRNALSISADANSNIIKVKATTLAPELSQRAVDYVIRNFVNSIEEINEVDNVMVLDAPKVVSTPVAPNKAMNTVLGGLLGGLIAGMIILSNFFMDKRLKSREAAEKYLELPVLGEIPYFD